MKGTGRPFEGVFIPQLQHPIEMTPDFILWQLLQRRAVGIHRARVFPHWPRSLRQRGDPTLEESMEDPQPVEAMQHKPLKLRLDNLQLVLLTGGTPRPAFPPLRPFSSERREWRFC